MLEQLHSYLSASLGTIHSKSWLYLCVRLQANGAFAWDVCSPSLLCVPQCLSASCQARTHADTPLIVQLCMAGQRFQTRVHGCAQAARQPLRLYTGDRPPPLSLAQPQEPHLSLWP